MHAPPDVVVVGAGPAGSATAAILARRGVRVALLDRARFPRPKPCAECVSPGARPLLERLGVWPDAERSGMALRGMTVRAPNGATLTGDFDAQQAGIRGLAVRREDLDLHLLEGAREAGARVLEATRVIALAYNGQGRVAGVATSGPAGTLRAPLVIGADGLRSVVARRLRLARRGRPRRIGIVTHVRGVSGMTDHGEMHVERDGFVGLARVGEDLVTVGLVVPAHAARAMAGDPAAFLHAWIARRPHLAQRFVRAEPAGPARVTGPFAARARRAWAPGAALVGDAADFFDPFTGEGIYAALRGAELLVPFALHALDAGPGRTADDALAAYHDARRRELKDKWLVERVIGTVVGTPWLMNRAARTLASHKRLADSLVAVTGHVAPPATVLTARYLLAVFLGPMT